MATETAVRICPDHGRVLKEHGSALVCPQGMHAVARWKVRDGKGREFGDGTFNEQQAAAVTEPRKEEPMTTTPPKPARPEPPKRVLERAKFVDGAGAVLWVRLTCEQSKRDGTSYRVRWSTTDEKGHVTSAATCVDTYQEKARTAYTRALGEAQDAGWERTSASGREVQIAPIPKPGRTSKAKR